MTHKLGLDDVCFEVLERKRPVSGMHGGDDGGMFSMAFEQRMVPRVTQEHLQNDWLPKVDKAAPIRRCHQQSVKRHVRFHNGSKFASKAG